jgi:hypothetical protein
VRGQVPELRVTVLEAAEEAPDAIAEGLESVKKLGGERSNSLIQMYNDRTGSLDIAEK